MDESRFTLVFSKLAEAQAEDTAESEIKIKSIEASLDELREIDELRRFSLEVANPHPILFTRA